MTINQIFIDGDAVITGVASSNILAEGAIEVDADTANLARLHVNRSRWVDGAVEPFDPPSPAAGIDDYRRAIQGHLDQAAQDQGYDGIQAAVGYRGDPNATYAAEAEALFLWRSQVWTYAFAELDKVQGGKRAQPTIEAFIAELPPLARRKGKS